MATLNGSDSVGGADISPAPTRADAIGEAVGASIGLPLACAGIYWGVPYAERWLWNNVFRQTPNVAGGIVLAYLILLVMVPIFIGATAVKVDQALGRGTARWHAYFFGDRGGVGVICSIALVFGLLFLNGGLLMGHFATVMADAPNFRAAVKDKSPGQIPVADAPSASHLGQVQKNLVGVWHTDPGFMNGASSFKLTLVENQKVVTEGSLGQLGLPGEIARWEASNDKLILHGNKKREAYDIIKVSDKTLIISPEGMNWPITLRRVEN